MTTSPSNITKSIVLFDGECNFCNSSVNFIWKRDKKDRFRFASLQSRKGIDILTEHNHPIHHKQLSTIVLIQNGQLFTKSTAVLKITKQLSGLYPLLYVFIIIPKPLRDYVYEFIAKRRHLLLKNNSNCEIPTQRQLSKFISD
jgi:predicted DCC family thiol-disulfide oxidoreductase YuxK